MKIEEIYKNIGKTTIDKETLINLNLILNLIKEYGYSFVSDHLKIQKSYMSPNDKKHYAIIKPKLDAICEVFIKK